MPGKLVKGYSKKAIAANFHEMTEANKKRPPGKRRSRQQIVAAVLATADRAAKAAGKPSKAPKGRRKA